ncbi:MAG: hypothetical protein B7Z16_19225 [Algoriphagus sp. 32-45-6]|nr:MAG: hypothetical protein B7Z16_19225 [Algoriphagus sp. 32-45-6]
MKKKIEVSNKPEDLFAFGKYVFVAGSEGSKIEIIDADTEMVTKILEVEGNPVQFFELNGEVWVFATSNNQAYFHSLNLSAQTVKETKSYPMANPTGRMAIGDEGKLYLILSTGWPDYRDQVIEVSLRENYARLWKNGSGLYGIGYDKARQEIYVANSKGFQGNGEVTVYSKDGSLVKTMETGRGPSGFLVR